MRTKFLSVMTRMFPIAAIVALTALISACSSLEKIFEGFPACRDLPPDSKTACTCTAETEDCKNPGCCKICGLCESETKNPTSQMKTSDPATPQVGLIGAEVRTSRGFGLVNACEPFQVIFHYKNFGNITAGKPLIEPKLVISENPLDGVVQPFTPVIRDIPWSSLTPGEVESKSEEFPLGIKPDNPEQQGTFFAAFQNIPVPTTVSLIQFTVGFFSSDCK